MGNPSNDTKNKNKDIHLGDGVIDSAKKDINKRLQGLSEDLIGIVFDYIEDHVKNGVKNLPEKIKQLRENPMTKKDIESLWSKTLYEKGLVGSGSVGLPDELILHNFRQSGYNDGIFVGHLLTFEALEQKGISREMLLELHKSMFNDLLGNSVDGVSDLLDSLYNEVKNWTKNTENIDVKKD